MAQQALVAGVREAARRLGWERGRAQVVALLPSSEGQEPQDEHYAVVVSAAWLKDHSVAADLARVGKALRESVSFPLQDAIARIVALPTTDPFVQAVVKGYAGRWTGAPLTFEEVSIAGRTVDGGILVELENPARTDVTAEGTLTIPEELPAALADQFEESDSLRHAPLSEDRLLRFRTDFVADRARVAVLEHLLGSAGVLTTSNTINPDQRIIVHTVLRRGPFIQGANWAEYRTWDLALAFERHLGEALVSLLDNAPVVGSAPRDDWELQRTALRNAASDISAGTGLAFLYDADPGIEAAVALTKQLRQGWWGSTLQKFPATIGEDGNTPVARLLRKLTSGTKAYAVDLSRFAKLTTFPVDEANSRQVVKIEEIDAARTQVLANSESGLQQLAGLSERMRRRFFEERLELTIEESWSLELADARAAAAIEILAMPKGHRLAS